MIDGRATLYVNAQILSGEPPLPIFQGRIDWMRKKCSNRKDP